MIIWLMICVQQLGGLLGKSLTCKSFVWKDFAHFVEKNDGL